MVVRQMLAALGADFRQEYKIGRYSVDFAIVGQRIAIEADSIYWHQHPERDARKTAYLNERGWTVVRLREKTTTLSRARLRNGKPDEAPVQQPRHRSAR